MTWQLDPTHSSIEFSGKHMLVSTVKGKFGTFTVDATVNEDDLPASAAVITVDAASLDSGVEQRDGHLRSPDFFDVETYPTIKFVSRKIEPNGGEDYKIVGDLTIRDVTREVVLDAEVAGPVESPFGGRVIALTAEGKINRKDWGLSWNVPLGGSGVLVGEQIKIAISAELVNQAA